MLCVTRQGSLQTYSSVRVVANIIMQHVWRLVPLPSSGQGGSARIVKCARLAGMSGLKLYSSSASSHHARVMFSTV